MSQLLDYLVENEPGFRKARLPALYSDFQSQRTLNPDGYQANISAWRRALSQIVSSGLAPSPKGATPSLLVLHADEQLLRALETKQYGRPLALGTVVRESLAAKDLIPLSEFLAARESIYHKPWSVWNLASWTLKQLGVADLWRSERLPAGQFVVVSNVEEVGRTFGEKTGGATHQSRFERTFSKTHFYKTFNDQLVEGRKLSEGDVDVLLTFLARDKGVILYDGKTVKIKAAGGDDGVNITHEDESIAQLKELVAYLSHQTALLSRRVDELTVTAKEAVTKKNRVAALAALRSKKLTEQTLERRFGSLNQLEEVAAKIEQAADNVALVKVMEQSSDALASLNARVGGAERVDDVVGRLREQMDAADEVTSILAEGDGTVVVDEAEIDDELAAMEMEEKKKAEEEERKKKEAERKEREAQMEREAELVRKRLEEEAARVPTTQPEAQKETETEDEKVTEGMMSRLSLDESVSEQKRPEAQLAG